MAIEDGVSIGDSLRNLGRIRDYLTSMLLWGVVTAVAVVWIAFWGLVARLHLQTGDLLSAGVVGVLFVLPATVGLAYYLRDALGHG